MSDNQPKDLTLSVKSNSDLLTHSEKEMPVPVNPMAEALAACLKEDVLNKSFSL